MGNPFVGTPLAGDRFGHHPQIDRSILLACILALGGCGVTGNTSRMTVALDAVPSAADLRPVRLARLDYEPEGTTLRNLEVFRWGKFDETDRVNLADSLEDTLKAATRGMRPSGAPVEIHVLIRTYFIAATGREGLVIAGVDWCAAGPDKRVLFQDAFYAAYTCGRFPNICTMGINKDAVHGAIVKRIAQDALAAAAGIRPHERAVAKTYSKFEDAAAVVPKAPERQAGEFLPANLSVERARMPTPIDWKRRLSHVK